MIYNVEQYSPEWWELRNGKVTASMMWAVTKKLKKGGESADRRNYRYRIASQILTGYQGQHDDDWKGHDVAWGEQLEATARVQYEIATNSVVGSMGFCTHPENERFGCSPDGIVGTDGIIQIKCPASVTHLHYLEERTIPEEYEPQLIAEMACTGRKWSDFVSFDPRMKDPKNQLLIIRLERDEKKIQEINLEVAVFLEEVDLIMSKIGGDGPPSLEAQLAASLEYVTRKDGVRVPIPF